MKRPHVLIVGDFVKHTGFARVNETIAAGLVARGWQVSVLAIGYAGDPTPLQQHYKLYPAMANMSDVYGMRRLPYVLNQAQPDVVLLVNDPWVVDEYLAALQHQQPGYRPPVAAYIPVDGSGLNPAALQSLDQLQAAIAYTDFGAVELAAAGYHRPIAVIPHGIDRDLFCPGDRAEARQLTGIDPDAFVVLLCDTNSWRKRHDLAIAAFAQFAATAPDARLLIHSSLVTREGWDLPWLCRRAGIEERVIWTGAGDTLTDASLVAIYRASNVRLSATGGEGWGNTISEPMACGIPVVAPRWAALAEWAADGALLVDCEPEATQSARTPCCQRHGVVMPYDLADALSHLHRSAAMREHVAERGLACVSAPAYHWPAVVEQFDAVLSSLLRDGDASGRYAVERLEAHHA